MELIDGLVLDRHEVVFLANMLRIGTSRMNAAWSPQAKLLIARICDAAGRFESQACTVGVAKADSDAENGSSSGHGLLDTAAAAKVLGITEHGARSLARRGVIPVYKASGRWLFPVAEVVRRAERRAS